MKRITFILFLVLLQPSLVLTATTVFSEDFEGETIATSGVFEVIKTTGSSGIGVGNDNLGEGATLTSDSLTADNNPGAWLQADVALDFTQELNITFDFYIPQEGSFDDMTVLLGDLSTGEDTAFSAFHVVLSEDNQFTDVFEANGFGRINPGTSTNNSSASAINNEWTGGILDDTWGTLSLTWTPSSGSTGVLTGELTRNSSGSFTTGSYTLPSLGSLGIGSANDSIIADNIVITAVPEPSSLALMMIAVGGMLFLKRRRS